MKGVLSAGSDGKAGDELPLRECAQAVQADGQSGAVGAGRNKVVTDGGEYADEPLQTSRRSEALHRSLSSPKGQMGVFRPVVESLMGAMPDCGHDFSPRRDVRAELVGDDALGRDALLFQQAPQQTGRGLAVAPGLQNLVENIALLIDRAPEPMFLSGDADDDLIEMPDVAAAGPLALEPANEILAEFESPTPHGLVGDQDPALEEHFLDQAQAQRESEIEPNGIGDNLAWEAVSLVVHGQARS